ncbi:hypothetical protein BMF94_3294 [Rhodotorula taiwanensis]|uniref:Uncharacterized protein n=1 Tax=Rhodotorula taiwanensis TaxID=741276 RepID=A0A2S5BAG0_9BASI|nr:hypothetical protein BMF94_3294 [Rhodotorula taiwanensis]
MLDRLPTELLELVVDATSHSIWSRKATLDSLSLVNKSCRRLVVAQSVRIVRVHHASAIEIIKKWPATRRKLVTTLLVGSYRPGDPAVLLPHPIPALGMQRLLAALPNARQIFLRNVHFSPQCHSLSSVYVPTSFRDTVDTCRFSLRLLRLDLTLAIQLDLVPHVAHCVISGRAFIETRTPILWNFHPPPDYTFGGIVAQHIAHLEIPTRRWETLVAAKLPRLESIFCTDDGRRSLLSLAHAGNLLLEARLQLSGHLRGAPVPTVFGGCPVFYEFVQPAFLKHLEIGDVDA